MVTVTCPRGHKSDYNEKLGGVSAPLDLEIEALKVDGEGNVRLDIICPAKNEDGSECGAEFPIYLPSWMLFGG